MEHVFCVKCGEKIAADAIFCPHCGASQARATSTAQSTTAPVHTTAPANTFAALPAGIKGWSWGAFWLNWVWAIFNKTWIGLLALIPVVNIVMAVILGIKGREWAWKNKSWASVEEFNRVQKKWSLAGWIVMAAGLTLGIAAAYIEEQGKYKENIFSTTKPTAAEEEITLDIKEDKKPVASKIPDPYPAPQLAFGKIDLLKAMKDIGMEDAWKAEFTSYLNAPQKFWGECVTGNAVRAQTQGGLSDKESQAYGKESCQGTTEIYYKCLNGVKLDDAMMCLQEHINDRALNGE